MTKTYSVSLIWDFDVELDEIDLMAVSNAELFAEELARRELDYCINYTQMFEEDFRAEVKLKEEIH